MASRDKPQAPDEVEREFAESLHQAAFVFEKETNGEALVQDCRRGQIRTLYADGERGRRSTALIDKLRSPCSAHVKRFLNDREDAILRSRLGSKGNCDGRLRRSDDLRDKRGNFSREAAGEFKGT